MLSDYDGVDVFDADGDKIGDVERTYVDDNFKTQFVKVKLGTLLAKHRLVPLDDAEAAKDGLHVPYSKDVMQHSPDVSHFDDTLDADVLDQVRAYYGEHRGVTTYQTEAGQSVPADNRDGIATEDPRGEAVGGRTGPNDAQTDG